MLSAWFYALWRTQIAKRTKQLARKLAPLAGFFGSSHSCLLFLTITHFLLSPPHTMTSLASPPHTYRLSSLLTSHSWLLWLLFLTLTFFPLDLALTFSSFQPYTHTLQISYFNSYFLRGVFASYSLKLIYESPSTSYSKIHWILYLIFKNNFHQNLYMSSLPYPHRDHFFLVLRFLNLMINLFDTLLLSSSYS